MNRPTCLAPAARWSLPRLAAAAIAVASAAAPAAITTVGDVVIGQDRVAIATNNDAGPTVGSLTITPPDAISTDLLEVSTNPGALGSLSLEGGQLQAGWARIGSSGVADVTVTGGGLLRVLDNSFPSVTIGDQGVGTLTVTGAGSSAEFSDGQQSSGTLYLGGGPQQFSSPIGRGVIRVQDGATLRTGQLQTGAGVADVTVEGAGSTWRIDRGAFFGNADVVIRDGARVLSQDQFGNGEGVAFGFGGVTRATISGEGTLLYDNSMVGIALGGLDFNDDGAVADAHVLVDSGADVLTSRTAFLTNGSDGDYGTLELTGDGTTWTTESLSLPDDRRSFGNATILIRDGAVLRSSGGFGDLTDRIGRNSRVEIDGARSRWDSGGGSLSIAGELAVSGGARHSVDSIRSDSDGEVSVVGAGSELAVTGFQQSGFFGTTLVADGAVFRKVGSNIFTNSGEFTLDNGSIVTSQNSSPFVNGGVLRANGVIEGFVQNAFNGSDVDAARVIVGRGDSLRVSQLDNEAVVTVTGGELDAVRGFNNLASGVLQLNDAVVSTSLVQSRIYNEGRVEFIAGDSTVEGTLFNSGVVTVAPNATARIADELLGYGDMDIAEGGRLILDGYASLQSSTGAGEAVFGGETYIFDQSFVFDDSPRAEPRYGGDMVWRSSAETSWHFTEAGAALATVGGDVTLGGSLSFLFVGRFADAPLVDGLNSLLMIDAASVTGEFATQLQWGEQLYDRVLFRGLDYTDTTVSLLVEQIAAGDLNADGAITWEDHDAWVAAFGASSIEGWTLDQRWADGNGDGVVDAADYTVWRDAYAALQSPAAVPEPATLAMLACLAATRRR